MSEFLVTGGCGFIGSHLVDRLLADGHKVRVFDDLSTGKRENLPANVELIEDCITDATALERAAFGVDGIYHLAAIASVERSNEAWAETHKVNLTGTINAFEAARYAGPKPVPVVYASSAAVYGDTASPQLSEFDKPGPLTAYGADKYGCELSARVAGLVHQVPTVGLRFFNVYGPRQDPKSPYSGVISIFLDRVRENQALRIFGDGEQCRDFVFVEDVVEALTLAFERAGTVPLIANVCTGKATTVNELASLTMRALGNTVLVRHGDARRGDIRSSIGNISVARQKLGFEARLTLIEGLRRIARTQPASAEGAMFLGELG